MWELEILRVKCSDGKEVLLKGHEYGRIWKQGNQLESPELLQERVDEGLT